MALIAGVAAAYALGANEVLAFWIAYILTRPLGASFGDMLSQSRDYGGLGFGTIYTSLAFLAVIIALVGWIYVYVSATWLSIALSLGWIVIGCAAFLVYAKAERTWPFGPKEIRESFGTDAVVDSEVRP